MTRQERRDPQQQCDPETTISRRTLVHGLAAVAGYPHLTVPMGMVKGLPVGLSFIGPKWSEARLLSLGYAYEQARGPFPAPKFYRSIEESPEIAPHLRPAH